MENENIDFLVGNGDLADRIRKFDWSATPIGALNTWSPALRTVVRIRAVRLADFWRFEVVDNGIGIEPEYKNTIFGLLKGCIPVANPGTGFRLALCQRIVDRYQ